MSQRTYGLVKNSVAGAAFEAYRILKFGATEGQVIRAAAGTDALIGVSTDIPADALERADVVLSDLAPVLYGGTVTQGSFLTSDATGRAIVASPGDRTIGIAWVSGVVGDIGSVLIQRGKV